MLPLRLVYLAARRVAVRRFVARARRARRIQGEVLLKKVRRHAESDFGRRHGLGDIRSVDEFRRRMPVSTYEDYRADIERVKRGELTAMFAPDTKLWMFALTSGTSGKPKFIPVTDEFFREYRRGWNIWGVQTYLDHLDLVGKYTLQLTSNWQEFYTEGGIPCGQISGLAAKTAPPVSRSIFLLPKCLSKIPDSNARRYVALRLALPSPKVGMLVTANPSTLIELARLADRRRESLIRDIHDGTLARDVFIPAEVRERLALRLARRDPQRARQLEGIIERTGRLHPVDFWPRTSVLAVWTGGSVGAYLPKVREYYGGAAFRDHGLSASEGRMTIPLVDGACAGMIDYETSYFEFIPEQEHDSRQPTVLEAHELEPDRNYYIVLTTSSGFYRYDIHDLVRCVGFEGEAPKLEFLNKGSGFANLTGEKLSEFQVVSAVRQGFAELELPFEQFTMAPEFGDPPGYVVLLENLPPGDRRRIDLAERINGHLMRLNTEYQSKQQSGRLRPVSLRRVPQGTWDRLKNERLAYRGVSPEQYKHSYLVHGLDVLRDLTGRATTGQ